MRDAWSVIVQPVITEKSTRQIEEENVYTFVVDEKANKGDISHAIEKIWDVQVADVRTMRYAGKVKRALLGRMYKNWVAGRSNSYKKAVVKLAEGDHIEFYEVG